MLCQLSLESEMNFFNRFQIFPKALFKELAFLDLQHKKYSSIW